MKLIDYAEREKLTLEEIAAHLDLHKNTIYRIAKEIHYPKPSVAKLIEEFTNGEVTVEDLYSNKPRKTLCPYCGHKLGQRSVKK